MQLAGRLVVAAVFLVLGSLPAAAEGYWRGMAEAVNAMLGQTEALFAGGDGDGAKRVLNEAYFRKFEDSKMEAAIRKEVGAKRAAEIERMFGALRKAVTAGDRDTVKALAAELRQAVSGDAAKLDAANIPPEVFKVNQ